MDTTAEQKPNGTQEEKYVEFPCLSADATRDGKPALNKYSQFITQGHDFPGAQVRQRQEYNPFHHCVLIPASGTNSYVNY